MLLAATLERVRGADLAAAEEGLRAARERAEASDRPEVEMAAIGQLAHIAWRCGDMTLLAMLRTRVAALLAEGHEEMRGFAALGEAMIADVLGNDLGALTALDEITDTAPAEVRMPADWLRCPQPGEPRTCRGGGRLRRPGRRAMRVASLHCDSRRSARARQACRIDEVLALAPTAEPGADALPRDRLLGNIPLALLWALMGDVDRAVDRLSVAAAHAESTEGTRIRAQLDLAEGVIVLAWRRTCGRTHSNRSCRPAPTAPSCSASSFRCWVCSTSLCRRAGTPGTASVLGPDADEARAVGYAASCASGRSGSPAGREPGACAHERWPPARRRAGGAERIARVRRCAGGRLRGTGEGATARTGNAPGRNGGARCSPAAARTTGAPVVRAGVENARAPRPEAGRRQRPGSGLAA